MYARHCVVHRGHGITSQMEKGREVLRCDTGHSVKAFYTQNLKTGQRYAVCSIEAGEIENADMALVAVQMEREAWGRVLDEAAGVH